MGNKWSPGCGCCGDCCDQGPATEITLSGGTGCWAAANGTFALTLQGGSDCISEYVDGIAVSNPCTSGYCASEVIGARTAYWNAVNLSITVTPEGVAGGVRVSVVLRLNAYELTGSCVLFISGGSNLIEEPNVEFDGSGCRPSSFSGTPTSRALFGTTPDIDTLVF